MSHDQLFKELLRTFFREFLELFFPTVAARLNFDTVRFLEQEFFTDLPEGQPRRADTIAEVETLDGEPEIIIFHVEVERLRRTEFRYRMWEYFALIRLRTERKVYPIAIYLSPGAGGLTREQYTEELFGDTILNFHFAAVGLPDLSADDYRESENPVGIALSALMKPSRIGSVLQKWDAIRRVLESSALNEGKKLLLTTIVDRYVPLSETQVEEYDQIVTANSPEEIMEFISSFEERGIEKGILRGKRAFLISLLGAKFGVLSPSVVARVQGMNNEELDTASTQILSANSLSEMGLTEPQSN